MNKSMRENIPGVTGFGHWPFLERLAGERGFNSGQLPEGASTTPWMVRKISFADAYADELYQEAAVPMKEVYADIVTQCKELAILRSEKAEEPTPASGGGEEAQRQAAAAQAKAAENELRRKEILLNLAQRKADLDTIDEELGYRLDRVSAILRSHIASYWQGILKAAQNCALPAFPPIERKKTAGETVYEKYKAFADELLDRALNHNIEEGILYAQAC